METDYALLADMAQVDPSGKVHIIGGGLEQILAKQFPATHPILTLVTRIEVLPSECDREHRLEVELWGSDGPIPEPRLAGRFKAKRNPDEPTHAAYVNLALVMLNLQFPRAGDYAFHILIDGNEKKRLPLRLRTLP